MILTLNLQSLKTRQAVLAISLDAYGVEAELLGVSDFPPLQETVAELADNAHSFLGYYQEEVLSGVIELNREEGQIEICRLVVASHAFRMGIGSRLVKAAIALGPPVRVMTAQANAPAIRLYERHGFQIVAVDENRVPGLPLVELRYPAP